ncbi:hypothetical protein DCAR_0313187 [Daucus carota subsp. sativus]|uniref:DUF4216 domain-containing protein n=1 Tax=Daucus carota subsp. sativus TaxID=79200 RepID=A0AAF1ASM7_DAUCS|nr:hypothetical protein DCAR_0313187 [Daucus carota subsp. sativus]
MGPDKDQVSCNGYKVNGYEFHTKAYGFGKRTTNSGVCLQGDSCNELNQVFYGELEEIIELSYKGTYGGHINLLKLYYTPTPGRKRDRPPANWQVVIHTPARRREEVIAGDVYQEQTLHRPNVINVEDDEVIQLDDENEAHEIDPELLLVADDIDTDNEELLTDTDTEIDTEEDDGYESAKEDDSDSDSSDNGS